MTLRFLPFLFAILTLLAAAPGANAQNPPSLTIALSGPDEYSLNAGEQVSFSFTVSAAGATTQITVTPSIQVPAPWVATRTSPSAETFTLGGPNGNTQQRIDVVLSLPADAADKGVQNESMVLRATGQSTGNVQNPNAVQEQIDLFYIAPIPEPVIPPPDYTLAYVTGAVTLLILAAVIAYFVQARRVRLLIGDPIKRFNIGTGGTYKVTVVNPRNAPVKVQLRVSDLPKDWSAAFSFPVVPLNGKERTEVPLWVNVPLDAQPGLRQPFRIQARPNRFSPWLVTRRLEIDTLDVDLDRKSRTV